MPPRVLQRLLIGAEQRFLPGQAPLPSLAGAEEPATLLRPWHTLRGLQRAFLRSAGLLQRGAWAGCVWGDGGFGGIQPLSLQPQELLYCWGEAGPAPPQTGQAKAHVQLVTRSISVDSMIVSLCTPVCDYLCIGLGCRSRCGIFVLCRTSKWENHRTPVTPFNPFRLQDGAQLSLPIPAQPRATPRPLWAAPEGHQDPWPGPSLACSELQ